MKITSRLKQLESENNSKNSNIRLEKEVKILKNNDNFKIIEKIRKQQKRIDSLSNIITKLNSDIELSNNYCLKKKKL